MVLPPRRVVSRRGWGGGGGGPRGWVETGAAGGALRQVRIVAVTRPPSAQHPGARPIIGAIAPARADRGGADFGLAELARQLPVLIWLVDATGRVIYTHGTEAWRWGMQRP